MFKCMKIFFMTISNRVNIKTILLEEYVNFVDNTKKQLVFIIHTHIRLRSTNNTL